MSSQRLSSTPGRRSADRVVKKPALHVVKRHSLPVRRTWTDRLIETSHGRISIRETAGRTLPVILLHGNSSSKDVFQRQMDGSLGARYRMIAIDLPGHGASDDAIDPALSYTIPGYADAIVEALEQLDISHAVLFGWSLGGHVALEMMTRFEGTTGVMISGTSPVGNTMAAIMSGFQPHPHLALTGKAVLTERDLEDFKALTLGAAANDTLDQAMRRTDQRARARMFEHLTGGLVSDQRSLVETKAIPLAVVNGGEDPVVNVNYLTSLSYAKLWGRRCYLIPGTRHAPFLEQPEVFNAILRRFLRRMEDRFRAQSEHPSLCFSG